jgi:KH domain
MKIPKTLLGLVIGYKGCQREALEKKHNVSVHILEEKVMIFGNEERISQCEAEISALVGPVDQPCAEFNVPASCVLISDQGNAN